MDEITDVAKIEKAQEVAHKVLPEVIANVITGHLDDLLRRHGLDPYLLSYEGQPSYRAEAYNIADEIFALAAVGGYPTIGTEKA